MRQPDSGSDDVVTLGRIVGVHGVRGWLKIHSETDPRENIVAYPEWWVGQPGQWREINVLEGRRHGKTIIARLENIDDRDQAMSLKGVTIAVSRSALPELNRDEYYWRDLIGCNVFCQDHKAASSYQRIGRVKRLIETGANDVMVLSDERQPTTPGAELLVPWIRPDVVRKVNVVDKEIHIDWDPDY
ncbi:MAG: ribosome maturation factor RimM [Gammaproteobacteria bacterium]|nr:ribosome maturation factor RimM [Gammaproteobacteria bacterium]